MDTRSAYQLLVTKLRELARLEEALKLLEWDQATYMPLGAHPDRAEQMGVLAKVLHTRRTEPQLLELIDNLASRIAELDRAAAIDVRETKWRCDRLRSVPTELQAERAQAQAIARAAWQKACEQNSFEVLRPHMQRVLRLEREYAQSLARNGDLYQALLEDYEPGVSTAFVDQIFQELKLPLIRLAHKLDELSRRKRKHPAVLRGQFPISGQRKLSHFVAERLGFNFYHGRIDESAHPFSISIGMDRRITTRFDEVDLRVGLYSTLHELGHALYEQGLDPQAHGLPRGTACSLGIHESQSRLWENFIGRSEAFWRFLLPHAAQLFPGIQSASLEAVLVEANEARPTLIRTEADELTYNLHVLLRYDLERKLVNEELELEDLPEAWRQGMKQLLGINPRSDREGVLQDIHWSTGAFGYFPTYTLGNVFAAQFMEAAERAIGSLSSHIERGSFSELLEWLTSRIYRRGQEFRSVDLVFQVTGTSPSTRPLLDHLHRRFAWWVEHGGF